MIIVLKQDAPDAQVREFCHELQDMGLQINDSKGSDTHILGLIGDTKAIAESWVLANPVVETCRRVSEPYKKANRKFHPDDSVIDVNGVKIGGGNFAVIAGPAASRARSRSPTAPSALRMQALPCCAAAHSSPAPPPTPSRECGARAWTCSSWPAAPPAPPSSPRS